MESSAALAPSARGALGIAIRGASASRRPALPGYWRGAAGREAWQGLCSTAGFAPGEYQTVLTKEAGVSECTHLPALLAALQEQGLTLVSPHARAHLQPFIIPLASCPRTQETVSLLRLPELSDGNKLPIVRTDGPLGLRLLSYTAKEHLIREAASADVNRDVDVGDEGVRRLIQAANSCGELYKEGSASALVAKFGLNKYLALKVGKFPDVYEAFVWDHLKKGDVTSALIAAERNANLQHGWGRGFMQQAQVFAQLGREIEARDAAKMALMMPLWSLGVPFEMAAAMAGADDATSLEGRLRLMSRCTREAEMAQGQSTAQHVALGRTTQLLNCVNLGVFEEWVDIRKELQKLYVEGGRADMARFVAPRREGSSGIVPSVGMGN
mmetsp:Transcript_52957/g.129340  ORF Transcript_52957/g.129340 Transcript_52957/m.129340 type:complete len:384 (+) Transcript_52957:3-1154(+)